VADAVTLGSALLMAVGLAAAASAAGLADPTQPPPGYGALLHGSDPQSPDSMPEPVRLQMIARDGSQRMAVVNGHRVRPGDSIALDGKSVKVVAIGDDTVVLDRDGHRQLVELMPRKGLTVVCAANSSNRTGCRSDVPGAQR
jgi:hypothetical protein